MRYINRRFTYLLTYSSLYCLFVLSLMQGPPGRDGGLGMKGDTGLSGLPVSHCTDQWNITRVQLSNKKLLLRCVALL